MEGAAGNQPQPQPLWAVDQAGTDQVAQMIHHLHHHEDAACRRAASDWLKSFQESLNCWSVVDELLRENRNVECSHFAAQTMRSKIRSSFGELPAEAHASLRDSLVIHARRTAASGEAAVAVATQLSLALADLALRMSSWPDPVGDLLEIFGAGDPRALLEVLTVLPEEAASSSLRMGAERRAEIREYLSKASETVVDFLHRAVSPPPEEIPSRTQDLAVRCMSSWLATGSIDLSNVGANAIVAHAFRTLVEPAVDLKYHESATDCVCSLLGCLEGVCDRRAELLVFEGVLALEKSYLRAVASEDQDRALDFAKIFTELGESFLCKIVGDVGGDYRFAVRSLDLVLMSVEHPDCEVAEISFNLWYRLSEELYRKDDYDLTAVFVPYVERLIAALCRHCRMEPDRVRLLDGGDEFYEFRQKVADLIKDIVFVVGSNNCFKRMFLSLQTSDVTWEQTEATLFMMHALARNILPEEYEVVPKVVEAILSMPDAAHVAVRYSCILVLGELCEWISKHMECLPVTLEYLNRALQNAELSSVAGHALQNICSMCRDHMNVHLPGLILIVRNLDSFNLSSSAAVDILRGVATIIGCLNNHDQITTAMREVCAVQLVSLAAINGSFPSNDHVIKNRDSVVWLDRIAALFRYCKVDLKEREIHPCAPILSDAWPVLSITMDKNAHSSKVMERLCRCLRYMIRSLGLGALVLLDPLSKQMVATYTRHASSCFLYLASVLVSEFGSDASSIPKLTELFQMLIVPAFASLQGPYALDRNPDTIEDLFRLCQRFLQKLPMQFYQNPLIDSIMQCALLSCTKDHREANTSVLQFFNEIIHCAQSTSSGDSQSVAVANNILNQQGEEITKSILHLSMLTVHSHVIADVAEVLLELRIWNKDITNQRIENILRNFPQQYATVTPEQIVKFYSTVSQTDTKHDMTRALKDFVRSHH